METWDFGMRCKMRLSLSVSKARLLAGVVLATIVIAGCNSRDRQDKTLNDFKQVDQELQQSQPKEKNLDQLFEQAQRKLPADSFQAASRMHAAVKTCLGLLDSIRVQFRKFCGDPTGEGLPASASEKKDLTTSFFVNHAGAATNLFGTLRNALEESRAAARSDFSKALVNKLYVPAIVRTKNSNGFLEKYFKGVPPVGALVLLSSFETQLRSIEHRVLNDYGAD